MSGKIGSFQVLGNLGGGAHSSILHIRRNCDSRHYALKIVKIETDDDQKYLDQAEHEYQIAQKLDHPNLIKIHVLEKVKTLGLIGKVKEVKQLIEFVNGSTLDGFKAFPQPILLQIFRDVAGGMMMMHSRNICHGDLKPGNIMLSRSGNVKVIDYGLSWVKGEEKRRIQGTPEYMAPEQVRNRIVNEKTDIFNFGATLYRLITGHHIPSAVPSGEFAVPISEDIWRNRLKPVLDRNPGCSQRLASLVDKCLMFKPAQRPECMSQVHETLETLVIHYVKCEEDHLNQWEWE